MVNYHIIGLISLTAGLPLNINLGAYSPALVVGDGEISFGGRQDVSNLMNALQGAAVNAAAGVTQTQAAQAAAGDPILAQQAQQIATLQGMGKEIAPREDHTPTVKRDLAGFDRALKYAEAALVKGPKVQLGTGAEGSGMGIIVDNNPTAAARGGRGAEGAAAKRDVAESSAHRKTKITTMYVRHGVPPALQSANEAVVSRDMSARAPVRKPAERDAIDAVNLNMGGNEDVTLTFVEEVDGSEE